MLDWADFFNASLRAFSRGKGPMNSTAHELAEGFCGVFAFAGMFLAPGYVFARATALLRFEKLSRAERLLWSVLLSTPLAIAICALLSRLISPIGSAVLFGLLGGIGLVLAARSGEFRLTAIRTSTKWMLILMVIFAAYCLLATVDIQAGHKLYVSTVIADWSVRVAMVKAAMRSGVPPINGLSTLGGHAAALRYYYFWYIVVAQMARALGIGAHAALAASCVWAGWALMSAYFLGLKYMLGIRERLRAKCFVGLLLGAVLGLDILPTALLWLSPKLHPYPEMEYWHQDRTPSFLGSVLYAPHHMAAFAALFAGFLVLLQLRRDDEQDTPWLRVACAALFAGIAFAAAAGTSLFPTFCFVFILAIWAVDLLRRWEWRTLAALAAAGVIALLCAHPYLHELGTGSSAATGFASLRWRNDDFVAMSLAKHHLFVAGRVATALLRQPLVLLMDLFDLGFFWLVLFARVRRDFRTGSGRLTRGESALWAWVLGAAIPFLFLSSTVTSGPNDLGVDAGFLLRMALEVWAVAWVWPLWITRHKPKTGRQRIVFATAALLFCLGLSAQLYQVLSERLYYVVIGSGAVHKQMDEFVQGTMAERMYNLRDAMAQFDKLVPPSAPDTEVLQYNPVGPMHAGETIYTDHQVAAWDTGCGTSYGGDYKACAPVYESLLFLFGNTKAGVDNGRAGNDRQDAAAASIANDADFRAVCRNLHLRAIVAESSDSIWSKPTSWVWHEPVMVANPTVRILACPAL